MALSTDYAIEWRGRQENEQGDVDIEGEAWFTVVHRTDGAGDEISYAGIVQGTRKKGDQIRFGLG